jgi:hypothetical protein
MLMSFVYHRFHADRELSLLAGHAHPVGIDTANLTPLAMRVSRRECLQAGCNDCEFIGNEREQSVRLIGNESEQRNAIFASSPDYVCKLLHLNPQNFAIAIGKPRGRPWGPPLRGRVDAILSGRPLCFSITASAGAIRLFLPHTMAAGTSRPHREKMGKKVRLLATFRK